MDELTAMVTPIYHNGVGIECGWMDNMSAKYLRYLPVSSTDIDWGLYVTTAGYSIIPPSRPYPFAKHPADYHFTWSRGRVLDEYQIIYITDGSGVFESSASGEVKIRGGAIILLFPGVWHRYRPVRDIGWTEYWVGLKGEHIDRLAEKGFISPEQPIINIGSDDGLIEQFIQLIHCVETQPLGYQHIVSSAALLILATVLGDARKQQRGGDHAELIVQKAKTLLSEQLGNKVDMEKLAAEFSISYAHFRRVFKRYTDLSPNQYHLQVRVNYAKELLRNSDASIKAIASSLGFESQYYFSRIFKKRTGHSPSQWRSKHWREFESTPGT